MLLRIEIDNLKSVEWRGKSNPWHAIFLFKSNLHYFYFCSKIVMKDGKSLGYGIIEYKSWQEAEKSERHLNGHKVLDVPMRITYCIPGISAVTICTRLMSKFVSRYCKKWCIYISYTNLQDTDMYFWELFYHGFMIDL